MALRHLAPRFVDWRLSRIDEEVDRVSCSSDAPPSPPLPPPPPLLLDDDPAPSDLSPAHDDWSADEAPPEPPLPSPSSAPIYSNADEWRKQQLERSAIEDEREALRFIKEKYDSLGKVTVDKPTTSSASQSPAPLLHGAVPSDLPSDTVYENVPARCDSIPLLDYFTYYQFLIFYPPLIGIFLFPFVGLLKSIVLTDVWCIWGIFLKLYVNLSLIHI